MARSNEEWQALHKALLAIIDNPKETKERKAKAQAILDSSFKGGSSSLLVKYQGTQRDSRTYKSKVDLDYDGTIR